MQSSHTLCEGTLSCQEVDCEDSHFDARMSLLTKINDFPGADWSVAELMAFVQHWIHLPPWSRSRKRTTSMTAALGLLADYGIKPDWFLRTFLAGPLLRHIATMSALALNDINQGNLDRSGIESDLHPWIDLLERQVEKYPNADQGLESLIVLAVEASDNHVTRAWIERAAASHLVAWKLVDYLESPADILDLTLGKRRTTGEWIIDRFTKTYYADWSSSSRELEYLYINDKSTVSKIADLSIDILDQRTVSSDSLLTSGAFYHSNPASTVLGGMDKQEYFGKIVTFLLQGETGHAFSLARSAKFSNPLDLDIRSSLAFCAIPFDPALAKSELHAVPQSNFSARNVSYINMICAHISAKEYNQARSSLIELQSRLSAGSNEGDSPAWLWQPASLIGGEYQVTCCTPSAWVLQGISILENTDLIPDSKN